MRARPWSIAVLALTLGLSVGAVSPASAAVPKVTVASVVGGTGTATLFGSDGSGNYSFNLSATADVGYAFRTWECGAGALSDEYDPSAALFGIRADTTCTPTFREQSFWVTVETAVGGSATVSSDGLVPYFGTVTLTATPDEGFRFAGWSCADGTLTPSPTSNPATLGTVRSDTTCTPSFVEAAFYTVSISAATGGSATVTPQQVTGEETVTLTAVPNEGYSFSKWTCTGGTLLDATANPASLSGITADTTCTPSFTASVNPTPTPAVKKVQKPLAAGGLPPKRIRNSGVTVLTASNARTNADQMISTRVRCTPAKAQLAGEARYCTVIRGKQGKVSLRTYGRADVRVVLVQYAAPTAEYEAYRKVTVYRGGVKRS